MEADELRRRLTRSLGREVPSWVWRVLEAEEWVEDARINSAAYPEIEYFVRQLLEDHDSEQSAPRRRHRGEQDHVQHDRALFSDAERARAVALYEYFARLADSDEYVQEFRREALSDRRLTWEQAHAFVTDELNRRITTVYLRNRGLSPATCVSRVTERGQRERDGRLRNYVTFAIDGLEKPVTLEHAADRRLPSSVLQYPGEGETVAWVVVDQDSVLDDLVVISRRLCNRYPWEPYQAVWWVLTGAGPLWWPVRRRFRRRHTDAFRYQAITLTIEPWVSSKTVERAYRQAQERMLRGRDNRPVSTRNLEAFRFCVAHLNVDEELPPWSELAKEWNAACPKDRFKNGTALARVYERVLGYLAFPDYDDPS